MSWLIPEWSIIGLASYILIGMVRMYLIFVIGFALKKRNAPKIIIVSIFVFGFIYDIFLNWVLSIPTLDFPNKWDETITNRMKRYKETDTGWKYKFSVWMCNKLNKYDPNHC